MPLFTYPLFVVTLSTAVMSFGPRSAPVKTDSSFARAWKETDTYFQTTLKENQIVGGALLFLEKGQVKGSRYYGAADIDQPRAVDENTIFHWASITKTFTAIAIMQLRDRGRLTLDDPLTRYLPELRKVHNSFGSTDDITELQCIGTLFIRNFLLFKVA